MVALEEHTFAQSGDTVTFYLAAGPKDGPLIIFVHGWPGIGLLWRPQLEAFAALGFRVVAPDMPGYGRSSARRNAVDYCMEQVNQGMLALLSHLGAQKAIWIGHDWGCPAVWSFAAHYPAHCLAVAGLAVPYRSLELGLDHLVSTVDRSFYPKSKFPHGQWSYQQFYLDNFARATAFFDKDPEAVLRKLYVRGSAKALGHPAPTSQVVEHGGWFGGTSEPDPRWRDIPISKTALDEGTMTALVTSMRNTGFWAADAWYTNHTLNASYATRSKNNGRLAMPVLFIHAKWDVISNTNNPKMCAEMRAKCENLTESTIEAGHWVAEEQPTATTAVIRSWILEKFGETWPGLPKEGKTKAML